MRPARRPLLTLALLAGNLVAYLLSVRGAGSIIDGPPHTTLVAYGAIPYELTHLGSHCALAAAGFSQTVLCSGQLGVSGTPGAQPATWVTVLSSLFVHANLAHLAVDVLPLALLGPGLEARLRPPRFLALYVLGGVAGLALTVAARPGASTASIGAAGALAALGAAHLLLAGDTRMRSLAVRALRFERAGAPAWALVGVWLALEVALGALHEVTAPGGGAGTVALALAGGLAFGLLAAPAFARGGPGGWREGGLAT